MNQNVIAVVLATAMSAIVVAHAADQPSPPASGMSHDAMKSEMMNKMQSGGMSRDAMKSQMMGKAADGHSHQHGADKGAAAQAHQHAAQADERPYGKPGNPKKVNRTVNITMSDAMRFTPAVIHVKKGETIRFLVRNAGRQKHEMVLGTLEELKAHAELMKKNPEMEHDEHEEVQAAEVKPGRRGTLVWQFTNAGEFDFACLIPGHFDAGMVGKVIVK